jgi:hypothetical protein
MSIPFLTEDLARQRVVELRDEAGRLRTVRRRTLGPAAQLTNLRRRLARVSVP